MAQQDSGSVRIGPISIFVLIIALCLSVMAVLSLTTAQASSSEAQKQAGFASGAYANEVEAQEWVASLDGILAGVAAEGGSLADASARFASEFADEADIASVEGGLEVSREFQAPDGRVLAVALNVAPDLTYQILQWKLTTQWIPESTGNLWTGK